MSANTVALNPTTNYLTEEDVKVIVSNYNNTYKDVTILDFVVNNASDKMLGFLAEYWKVKVLISNGKVFNFFIKAISRSNAAKANMVRELGLFEKELYFYSVLKKHMDFVTSGLKPWSPRLVSSLKDAMVFEDLNSLQYKLRNKLQRFDKPHILEALKTLARFHASSIVFEEKRSKELNCVYRISDEYLHAFEELGYNITSTWFNQCMSGALEALEADSKFTEQELDVIRSRWYDVWSSAMDLSDASPVYRNVICHRDLWNNNIMFHYNDDNVPDDCLLVDYQAVRYQPPTGDVMLLLYCNLDPKSREQDLQLFLDFYYQELQKTLRNYNIEINNLLPKEEFIQSANEQRLWAVVACACLLPQFWINDDLTTQIFCDNAQFEDALSKNKGTFIRRMMENNSDYKEKVTEIFEELADTYCLQQ